MTIAEQIADWLSGLELESIPAAVRERAVLQTDAVLAAGRAGESLAAPFAAAAPDGPVGEVYAGAAASIAHDWDDYLFMGHTGHSAVWTSRAFAPEDPERALLAQIAANEVAGRFGAALFFGPHNGQFWASIHCAGAAAAAGVALGLDVGQLANALAIALYQPPYGLWPGFMGPQTKLLTAAEPASQGARAALLAADGVSGALDIVEAPRGFLSAFSFHPRPGMLGGLGVRWLTETIAFKPLPGCAYLQAAADAALRSGVDADEVSSIEVEAGWLTVAMESLRPPDGLGPAGINFSAARTVAVCLLAGRLTHEELDPDWLAENSAAVEDLAARVRVRHDPGLTVETMRGTIDAGASTADVTVAGWLKILGGARRAGVTDGGLDAAELVGLLRSRELRSVLRMARRSGGRGLASVDTAALRMSFPCRLQIRLRSGEQRTVEGRQRGSSGRPLDEQREVVEEKCRLVGLETPA
jgi:hypothetical protein